MTYCKIIKLLYDWEITHICHKPKITLSSLVSGTKYAVCIIASGTAGKSIALATVIGKVL